MNVQTVGNVEHGARLLVHHQNTPFGIQHQDAFDHAAQDRIRLFLFLDDLRQVGAQMQAHFVQMTLEQGNLVAARFGKKVLRE